MPRPLFAMDKVRLQTEADNAALELIRNPPAPEPEPTPEPTPEPEPVPTE